LSLPRSTVAAPSVVTDGDTRPTACQLGHRPGSTRAFLKGVHDDTRDRTEELLMAGHARVGSTAAALLPAALAAGVLVSAPFAGTTTAPLARGTAAEQPATASHPLAVLAAAEIGFLGIGAAVFVRVRRRRVRSAEV
jgi:hypothetical protein